MGKKVALLDFSCHSGANIERLSKFNSELFCLITGGSKGQISYGGFRNSFMKKISQSPSSTIEEIYLWSRKNNLTYAAAPFISFSGGMKTLEEIGLLEELISNGLWPVQLRNSVMHLNDCLNDTSSKIENLAGDVQNVLKHILSGDNEIKQRYISLVEKLGNRLSRKTDSLLKNTLSEIANHNEAFFDLNNFILYQKSGYGADLQKIKKNPQDIDVVKRIESFNQLKTKIQKHFNGNKYSDFSGASFSYGSDVSELGTLERSLYQKIYDSTPKSQSNACSTMKFN